MNTVLEGSLWDYTLMNPQHNIVLLSDYKEKVHAVLLVNIASRCGFTPQLGELEKLYQTYKEKGLLIIGVPSNDFMGQEPLSDEQVTDFCQLNYGVTFPVMSKTHVVSGDVHPLYQWIAPYSKPKWNFHKYLFDKQGHMVEGFLPTTTPMSTSLRSKIEQLLQ
jgi:glutathione peroxidase